MFDTTLKRKLADTGTVENSGVYVYSWHYELVLTESSLMDFPELTEEQVRDIHRKTLPGWQSKHLRDYQPLYRWIGASAFRPLTGKRQVIPQCIHIRPQHWYVYMDGRKAVMVKDDRCTIVRNGE